jgi:hypothetical protein
VIFREKNTPSFYTQKYERFGGVNGSACDKKEEIGGQAETRGKTAQTCKEKSGF